MTPFKMRNLKSQSGQALVEFVCIFLIFCSIILGVLHLTIFANVKAMANAAVYAACRKFTVTYNKSDAYTAAGYYLAPLIKIGAVNAYYLKFEPDGDPGFANKINATLTVNLVPWYLPVFLAPYLGKVETTCSMTME